MIVYNFPDKLLIESSIVESTLTNIPTAGTSFLSNRAIENGDFIFCFIMTSSLIIQCGTVQYDNNNLITDKLVPIEIMTCPSLTNPYFVMYKIGFNKIIIGCGKIEFNIQIVDE